jgi:hypothetical protein
MVVDVRVSARWEALMGAVRVGAQRFQGLGSQHGLAVLWPSPTVPPNPD